MYNAGWWSAEIKIEEEEKARSRAGSVTTVNSEKSETLFVLDKLAKMKPDKYKEYMDMIDK